MFRLHGLGDMRGPHLVIQNHINHSLAAHASPDGGTQLFHDPFERSVDSRLVHVSNCG